MWVKVVMAETIWLGVWGRECNIAERSAWRVAMGGSKAPTWLVTVSSGEGTVGTLRTSCVISLNYTHWN